MGNTLLPVLPDKRRLTGILVPYFKAGLENNEFCMWITSQPLEVGDAKEALRRAVPDLDSYLDKGQIEIIPYTCLHVTGSIYDSERVINYWIEKLNHALESGYEGLRLSGNTSWLEKKDWDYFVNYMGQMDDIIGKYRMIALGSYFVDKYDTTEIIEIVSIGHRLRSYFRFPLLFFESDPIISYSNHSSLNLFLFTCGSNA